MGKSMWTRQFLRDKKRLFVFDPLRDIVAEYRDVDDIPEDEGDDRRRFRYGITNPDDVPVLASKAFVTGKCYLVIEEAALMFPAGSRSPDWMRECTFLGRHQELSIVITAQRPTSIPVDMRSQCSRLVCFSQHERNDIGWLDSYYGDRSEEIPDLSALECLDYEKGEVGRYRIDPGNDQVMVN